LAVSPGSGVEAQAQVQVQTLNLTTTTAVFAPPPSAQSTAPEAEVCGQIARKKRIEINKQRKRFALPVIPPDECNPQKTKIKVSFPFNPTYESNVLKAPGNSPGTSVGFGGNVLVTSGTGIKERPYDLLVFTAGDASARYSQFPSKSLDIVTALGFYQFFIDGVGYRNGVPVDITPENHNRIPPQNLITIDTLSIGVQNQTVFLPTFHSESANLLTPQITLARTNISLTGSDKGNSCDTATKDPQGKNFGFCYYADLALTAGQTFSDQLTQQNANLAASVTPGWRIDHSDWKLALPAVATARTFENFTGGRQDLLLQIGPSLMYSGASLDTSVAPAVAFSLALSYYQNYSTVSAAVWHGVIIQPTLTVAFQSK